MESIWKNTLGGDNADYHPQVKAEPVEIPRYTTQAGKPILVVENAPACKPTKKPSLDFLGGYKTYILGLCAVAVSVAQGMGYDIPTGVMEVLVSLGLITLRSGMKQDAIKAVKHVASD